MSDLTMGGTYQIAINNVNNAPTADQKIKRKEKKKRQDWSVHEATEWPIHDKSLNSLKVVCDKSTRGTAAHNADFN